MKNETFFSRLSLSRPKYCLLTHPTFFYLSKYGFVVRNSKSHGVHFDEGSSDIEIDHIETSDNDYGGIVVRTYPRCGGRCGHVEGTQSYARLCTRGNFIQENTIIHDNYVHDTPGEGMYIGTSHYYTDSSADVYDPLNACAGETYAQPALSGVEIYNNLITDTGSELNLHECSVEIQTSLDCVSLTLIFALFAQQWMVFKSGQPLKMLEFIASMLCSFY